MAVYDLCLVVGNYYTIMYLTNTDSVINERTEFSQKKSTYKMYSELTQWFTVYRILVVIIWVKNLKKVIFNSYYLQIHG